MHLISELPPQYSYPDCLSSNDKSDIFSDEEFKTGVNVTSTLLYLSQRSNSLGHGISSINKEIIKNKTNSSQTLGIARVNNLTKDHVITDCVNETSQAQSFINAKKKLNRRCWIKLQSFKIEIQREPGMTLKTLYSISSQLTLHIGTMHGMKQNKADLIRSISSTFCKLFSENDLIFLS